MCDARSAYAEEASPACSTLSRTSPAGDNMQVQEQLEADPAASVASTVVSSEPTEVEGPEHREEVVHV